MYDHPCLLIALHGLIFCDAQRRHTELDELHCALAGAEEEAAGSRHALEECQGMVAELQAFSEAAQARAQVCAQHHYLHTEQEICR